jgi:hypothetical protein
MPDDVMDVTVSGVTFNQFMPNIEDTIGSLSSMFATSVAEHIARTGVLNAPIKTGLLRRSIRVKPPKKTKFSAVTKVQVPDAVNYAYDMYSFLSPHYTVFFHYGLGPLSRIQPSTPEGGVGGNYFGRVATTHMLLYQKGLAAIFQDYVKTGSVRKVVF